MDMEFSKEQGKRTSQSVKVESDSSFSNFCNLEMYSDILPVILA